MLASKAKGLLTSAPLTSMLFAYHHLSNNRGITVFTPLPMGATLYTHLLGSYKRQLDVQKSVVLSLL